MALLDLEQELQDKQSFTADATTSAQLAIIYERIVRARNKRDMLVDVFDGMSYENAYLSNRRAAMSYLQPKRNDDEVRVNTGVTEKRIELVLNELLALNLEEEIAAYDKQDNMLQDVSEIFTDIVHRTEQMELSRDKDIFIYQELLTQPSVYVEEQWTEKKISKGKNKFKTIMRPERKLLTGVQIYLGDPNIPDVDFNNQPYILKYFRMTYWEAKTLFGEFENFNKFVKPGSYGTFLSLPYNIYRQGTLQFDEVEGFYYYCYADDEWQLIINGVPMLAPGTSYTKAYGDYGGYHITGIALKPAAADSFYGIPLTKSAKTLQALDNETIRNLIRKFRQAIEPPMGVKGSKIFSRDIWNPGKIVQGIGKNDFEKLIDHGGVTRSEMAMFDLIEKKTNEFIGTSQQEPLQGKTQVTATEIMEAQKRATKLLGLSVLACMRLKERLALLRTKTVWNRYTQPVGKELDPVTKKIKEVFARFSIDDASLKSGKQGTKVIQMMDRSLAPHEEQQIFDMEQGMAKEGRPTEIKTLNVTKLKELDLLFYANVTAKPRESNQLDRAQFQDELAQGVQVSQITGRKISPNKVIQKFERIWKDKDFFEKDAPQLAQQVGANGAPQAGGSGVNANIKTMMNGGQNGAMPSVSDMPA